MCGICGEIRTDGSAADIPLVKVMCDSMERRGPDSQGVFAQKNMAFGQRRLKIIDLSEHAQQPMFDPYLGIGVTFNGAIYNYKELKKELEGLGYSFYSNGDTEVIIKAYHAWGEDFVSRFNGMFAIVLWERDTGKVVICRDRLGIKPLYYVKNSSRFVFASSLPALLNVPGVDKDIDPVALHHYMTFHSVVPAPWTMVKGIRKVPPATVMVLEPGKDMRERVFWEVDYDSAPEGPSNLEEWKEEVLAVMRTSVKRRLVADVPVGVLLSGGLDSSLVVGLLSEAGQSGLTTFSVGFEAAGGEKGDEFQYSDIVVDRFKTNHHKIFVDTKRALQELPRCFHAMSEPMVSHDNIGFYLLSEEVSKHVKVVQSGQGADEIFAGYHWYPPMMGSKDPVADYAGVFFDRDHAEYLKAVQPEYAVEDVSRDFVAERFARKGAKRPVDKALRLDSTIMLVDDPVKRVDNMTMAWGLEARVPFLDHEVVETAARVPAELKVKEGGKYVLKEAARKVIPSEVIDRPKGYFPVPALKYLQGPYLEMVKEVFRQPRAKERRIFREEYLDMLFKDPEKHITPLQGSKLWQAALLEFWLQSHEL